VAARLVSRAFGGYESLQLEIRDVASADLGAGRATPAAIAIAVTPTQAPAVGGAA